MADLAQLGLAVDLSQVDAASKSLSNFSQSGKNAQVAADVLVASAVRLGISVEEVQRRLAAANDNMAKNSDQAMKMADATKQVSAANDNLAKSMGVVGKETEKAGKGFFGTIKHAMDLFDVLKLLGQAAYFLVPQFRNVVNANLGKMLLDIIPTAGIAAKALNVIGSAVGSLLSFMSRIALPLLAAAAAFELLSAIWTKGAGLLDKYANSLRALGSSDTVQNLERLTKGQWNTVEPISAEQIQRATELGVRLQDASFIIDRYMKTSIFNLTDISLKLQSVWVKFVEIVARVVQYIQMLPLDKLALVAKVVTSAVAAPVGAAVNLASSGSGSSTEDTAASLEAARGRLSAIMGVANLAAEALENTKDSVTGLSKQFDLGESFIVKFDDALKKLNTQQPTDSWDKTAIAIDKASTRLDANAASVGQTIQFQESLRVETQLLASTYGSLKAVTDKQLETFIQLRVDGVDPLSAAMQAGIDLDEKRAATFVKLGKAAGDAKQQMSQEAFAITNQKALDANELALKSLRAYSAAQKGAVAGEQVRLQLQDELTKGSATKEQVDARVASASKLAIDTELKGLEDARRARTLSAEQTVSSAKVSIDAIGKSVGESYKLNAIEQARQQLEQDASARRGSINQKELADLTEKITRTSILKQAEAEKSAQDQANFSLQTAFMSQIDQQIAATQKQLHGNNWSAYMNDGLAANLRLVDSFKILRDSAQNFAGGLTRDLLNGVPAVKALENALKTLASSLIDSAVKKLVDQALSAVSGALSGAVSGASSAAASAAILNTAGASVASQMVAGATAASGIMTGSSAISAETLALGAGAAGQILIFDSTGAATVLTAGGQAAGAAIWGPIAILAAAIAALAAMSFFGGEDDNELKQAQESWKNMAGQVKEFNRAADGFNLGPLTQSLETLRQTHDTLAMAALEARDYAGLNAIHETMNRGTRRVLAEFINGTPVMGEFATALKALHNEAQGLTEAIPEAAAAIQEGLIANINRLREAAETSLKSDINSASGFGWLNDINSAIAKFNELSGQVDASLLNTWMTVTLQKIVDDAQLTGEAFQRLITGIPQIAGYIHEYSEALDESGRAARDAAAAIEKANLQMRLLVATTDQSTLAGALKVNALRQEMELNEAIAAKSQNIELLKQVQAAETYNIQKSFADKAIADAQRVAEEQARAAEAAAAAQARAMEEAQNAFDGFVKNITDFIAHYLAGPTSGLSPLDQLTNAQSNYSSQLALAQGGDRAALNSITQYFSDLVRSSDAYYASSAAGQAIKDNALAQLQALPTQISPEQFIVNAIEASSTANVSALDAMQLILSTAFDTNNVSSFAGVLQTYLPSIDTNSDGSITLLEMQTALNTTRSAGTIKAMFDKIDTNLDGKISDVELNTAIIEDVKTNTDPIVNIETNTDGAGTALATLSDISQLNALANIALGIGSDGTSQTVTSFLADIRAKFGEGIGSPFFYGSISVGEAAGASREMLKLQNQNWGRNNNTPATGVNIGVFEKGGFTGYGSGIVGVVHEQEYVLRKSATSGIGRAALDYMNDNARMPTMSNNIDIVSELRALRAEVSQLRIENGRNQKGAAEHLGQKLDVVVENTGSVAKANRRMA